MDRPDVRYARTADGFHIAYQAFGAGRYDIVFIPGQLSHLDESWESTQDAAWMRRLATLGRVIVLDRRGVGLSDRLSPRDAPSVEVLVEDLGSVIDAAGATRPILLGCASGGGLASLFAAIHPNRVHGLMVYGMWSHVTPEMTADWRDWISWSEPRWGSLETALNDLREVEPSRAGDAEYVARVARLQRLTLSPGSIRPFFEAEIALDVRDVLPTITVPTLVMFRPRDSATSESLLRSTAGQFRDATVVELPGSDHWWTAEPTEPMFAAIEAFMARLGGDERPRTRRLATVLFTDVVDSTARAAELGDRRWSELLDAHHRLVRRELERHGGTEVDTAGDGFLATFDGPARAVECAGAIESALAALGLSVRAGVHTGEVEAIDGKIGGIGVHIGARVGALAGPGEVLVSSTVKDLTAGSGLVFEDAGEHELKGVPDRWRLYRVAG